MATPVTYNGVAYSIPAFGDVGYAQGPGNLSSYLIALASGPQASGGLFSLTAPLNFGPNFGLIAVNFTSTSANPATAGTIRLANLDTIDWRNFANSANLVLGVNASDQLTFQGVALSTAATAGTVSAGTAGRLTLYPATGNTVDDVYIQNSQNIDVLIATQAARSVGLEYTIPNPGNAVAAATFALLELAQTFTATQTFAAATFTGLITGVNETLSGLLTLSATTNQLVFGTTNTVTINSIAPAASRVYTIPDAGAAASFVMTAGAQTITGAKTFIDQTLLLQEAGGLDVVTINTVPLAASRAYSLPDAGGPAQFVMTAGNQSIAGVKTFTGGAGAITLSGSTLAMGGGAISASGNLTFSPTTAGVVGTTTNDNTAAGNVGEYVASASTGSHSFPATGTADDVTTISLTAGDWDISFAARVLKNGGSVTQVLIFISSTAGNSLTGLLSGDNCFEQAGTASIADTVYLAAIPNFRVSLASTTTYRLKCQASYTVATPLISGYRLSARRIR